MLRCRLIFCKHSIGKYFSVTVFPVFSNRYSMAKQYRSLHPTKFYRDYLSHDIRPDGREFTKFRPVIINSGSIGTADGSAITKVGDTTVICGIKLELCKPKAETPNEGFLIPNIELHPICSSRFRPGPPSDQAQINSKALYDILNDAKCIDLKDLCIEPDKLVWCLYADIVCLDHNGCVLDASVLALVAALKTVKLPVVKYDATLDHKDILKEKVPLRINSTFISTTYAIFEGNILTDPTAEEESLCTGIVTVVIAENEVCTILKPGGTPLKEEQLLQCIKQSMEQSRLLEGLIEASVG